MSLIVATPPASEAISLPLAKAHLRLDSDQTDQDELVSLFIAAAREMAEHALGRAIMQQTLTVNDRLAMLPPPALPYQFQSMPAILYDRPGQIPLAMLSLPRVTRDTLGTISAVTLIGQDNSTTSLSTTPGTDWFIDYAKAQPRLLLVDPHMTFEVEVTYQAGWATADLVPAAIKKWMLFQINSMFEHREAFVVGQTLNPVPNEFIDASLNPWLIPAPV